MSAGEGSFGDINKQVNTNVEKNKGKGGKGPKF
jgi:hypothetical protein